MFKKSSIPFILALLVFGSLVLLPGRVEAGSPGCQDVTGTGRTPSAMYPLTPNLPGARLKPPKTGPGGQNLETSLRRTASTSLSLLMLIGGLAALTYALRKLLRQMQDSRNRQPYQFGRNYIARRAFASVLLV